MSCNSFSSSPGSIVCEPPKQVFCKMQVFTISECSAFGFHKFGHDVADPQLLKRSKLSQFQHKLRANTSTFQLSRANSLRGPACQSDLLVRPAPPPPPRSQRSTSLLSCSSQPNVAAVAFGSYCLEVGLATSGLGVPKICKCGKLGI